MDLPQQNIFGKIPLEILDMITSLLSEMDFIAVQQVIPQFEDSLKRVIKKRKLNFEKCYYLNEKELLYWLRQFKEEIKSLNLSDCYWFSAATLKSILKLPKLKQLHIPQCKLTPLVLSKLLEKDLEYLTITWDFDLMMFLQENQQEFITDNFSSNLFDNLKTLRLYLPETDSTSIQISSLLLQHCAKLESLFIYHVPVSFRPFSIHYGTIPQLQKTNLPCLRNVSLDLHSSALTVQIMRTLVPFNLNPSVSFYLGTLMMEMLAHETRQSEVNDSIGAKIFDSPAIDKLILTATNNSPRKHLSLHADCERSGIYDMVTEFCPLLQTFSCDGIFSEDSNFSKGLENIATKCKHLTHLILAVDRQPMVDNVDDHLINIVSHFKNLTHLSIRTNTVSVTRNLHVKNTRIDQSMINVSREAQESCSFYKIIKNCQNIEKIGIYEYYWPQSRIVPECVLASISNLYNLKELYLVNIPTIGTGLFLPIITKNCKKLETLFLSNICNKATSTMYTPSLIESLKYATNLKVLSIQQNLLWSWNFCQGIEKCTHLQRIYIDNLSFSPEDINHFIITLSHLKKLIAVFIRVKPMTCSLVKLVNKKLKSLKKSRPPLSYYFGEATINLHSLPTAHADLGRFVPKEMIH